MASLQNLKIGLLCSRKKTDALVAQILAEEFPNLKVLQYQIPILQWLPWGWQRIRKMGFFTLIGHLALLVYLRAQQILGWIKRKNIWQQFGNFPPSFKNLRNPPKFYWTEKQLMKACSDLDVLVLSHSFRLSHRFFRRIKIHYFQIIWGKTPEFVGDSGAFWAYALGEKEKLAVSLVQRGQQIQKLELVHEEKIVCSDNENLRTIKVKQALALKKFLVPQIKQYLQRSQVKSAATMKSIRTLQVPTLFTYLKFLKFGTIETLPPYATGEMALLNHKNTVLFSILGLYGVLLLHEINLYPNHSLELSLGVAFLRILLLLIPILLSFWIVKVRSTLRKVILIALWLLVLPYTLYSVAEIRHLSEMCPLEASTLYTDYCVQEAWTLIPTFIYAATGVLGFIFSCVFVSSNLFPNSIVKRSFISFLCLWASFSSLFGLYTRLNVWQIFIQPSDALEHLLLSLNRDGFFVNFIMFFILSMAMVFVGNRFIRYISHSIEK